MAATFFNVNPAVDGLRDRGLLEKDEPVLADSGRELRASIETATYRAAAAAYRVLGVHGCTSLADLTRPMSRTVVKSGGLNIDKSPRPD